MLQVDRGWLVDARDTVCLIILQHSTWFEGSACDQRWRWMVSDEPVMGEGLEQGIRGAQARGGREAVLVCRVW
jgi:hypothetical protein